MISIILGNISYLFGMLADSFSSTRKTAKGVLYFLALGQFFYCVSSIFLKGYSAAVQSAVSVVRNLAATNKEVSKIFECVLIGLGVTIAGVFGSKAKKQ